MKKFSILAALVASFLGSFAEAQFAVREDSDAPGWCHIQARLRVRSGAFIVGGAEGHGYGRIVCDYADDTTEVLPIRIDTIALGVGFEMPEEFDAKMFTSGLIGGTDRGAIGYLGSYLTSRLAVGVGPLNGEFGVSLNTDGFSIPMTVQLDQGFQFLAASLKFGEMNIRFDPKNLQSRHARDWRREFPEPPRQGHPHAGKPTKKPRPIPVPPRRPKDLGGPVGGVPGAETAPKQPPVELPDIGSDGDAGAGDGAGAGAGQ